MKTNPPQLEQEAQLLPDYDRGRLGATVLAVANLKGGVGKTTTAVNLAAALSIRHRVLLVDLDSQASATLSFGFTKKQQSPSILDVMLNYAPLGRATLPTHIPNLSVVPASVDLAKFDAYVANSRHHIYLLQRILESVRHLYDFIILDCPPSLSLITLNAFIAADAYIAPVTPHGLAFEAMKTFFGELEVWQQKFRVQARRLGVLLTMLDTRSNHARKIKARIQDLYGDDLFETEIKTNIRITEAPDSGKSVMEYDGGSSGARAYWAFAKEVLKRLQETEEPAAVTPQTEWPGVPDRQPIPVSRTKPATLERAGRDGNREPDYRTVRIIR